MKRLKRLKRSVLAVILFSAFARGADSEPFNHSTIQPFNSYTNHAGNVVSGVVVALDRSAATISNATETAALPLSIFPEPEQRRIAADFVLGAGGAGQVDLLRVPVEVKRAFSGAEKAIARSRKRAEKGLCTQEESDAFCEQTAAALASYLDGQAEAGVITPAERKALGRPSPALPSPAAADAAGSVPPHRRGS